MLSLFLTAVSLSIICYTKYMSIPNVDTFEHDISEEIKAKDATIADIAAAGGSVENLPVRESRTSSVLLLMGALSLVVVIGIFVMLYMSYRTQNTSSVAATMAQQSHTTTGVPLPSLSPSLDNALGGNIGNITPSEYGYTLQVLSYTNVYAYMLKNESAYADELAKAVGSPRDTSTTSMPFMFTDVTLNNQNMRVGTTGSSTVVYAFVNTNTLVVSSTTEGILTLRSAILK